jgi:hypothetical protein
VEAAVLALRRSHPVWGGSKIAAVLAREGKVQLATSTVTGIRDGVNVILKGDLLRQMREPHQRQPAPVCTGPALLAGIVPAMPQQKALHVLARLACHAHRRGTRPDQIAHRLVRCIRNPHHRQFPRPMQLRQHHRITTVRLHPVARRHRDERGGHHDAVVPQFHKLAMQAIAARP